MKSNADIKVICPECSAEFVPCDKDGNISNINIYRVGYVKCPEPFNCELSGVVYIKPGDIKLKEA